MALARRSVKAPTVKKRERAGGAGVPTTPASEVIPESRSLPTLSRALGECRGCALYANGTRPVFGEGPKSARVLLVGEQPGDVEEREGHPFVGPAGRVLAQALADAGLERKSLFITNAVKHFNFEPRGKARLHKRPLPAFIRACRPWLEAEIAAVRPRAIVLLGAVASMSLLGNSFRLTARRGEFVEAPWAELVIATWHPSMALRAPDSETRERVLAELTRDLKAVAERL